MAKLSDWLYPSFLKNNRTSHVGKSLTSLGTAISTMGQNSYSRQFGIREAVSAPTYSPAIAREVTLLAYRIATANPELRNKITGDIVENHPFLDFLEYGSPMLNGLMSQYVSRLHYESVGEYFWMLVKNSDRSPPIAYIPISPTMVKELPSDRSPFYRIDIGGSQLALPPEVVFYHKNPDPSNIFGRGKGTVQVLADEIDTDEYTASLIKHTLLNKGFIDLLIAVSGANADVIRRAEMQYNNRNSGYENAGKAMFVNGDKLQVQRVTQSFEEMKLLDMRNFSRTEVRQTFGTPPELHGDVSNSNRSTIDNAMYIHAINQLDPRLRIQAQHMTDVLLPMWPGGDRLELVYPSLAPEDFDRKLEIMRAAPYAVTVNEWRECAGLDPLEDEYGEKRYIAAGMVEVTKLGETPPAPVGLPSVSEAPEEDPDEQEYPDEDEVPENEDDLEDGSKSITGYVGKSLTSEQLVLIDRFITTRTGAIAALWKARMEEQGQEELIAIGMAPDTSLIQSDISAYMDDFLGTRVAGIDDTTRDIVRGTLTRGIAEGKSPRDMARELREKMEGMSAWRAETIARTESARTLNTVKQMAWQASGVPLEKVWVATGDLRTRDTHRSMDGVAVGVEENFTLPSGATGPQPGDISSAAESVNCRCTTRARASGSAEEESLTAEDTLQIWKQFETKAVELEEEAQALFKSELNRQQQEVVEYLESLEN